MGHGGQGPRTVGQSMCGGYSESHAKETGTPKSLQHHHQFLLSARSLATKRSEMKSGRSTVYSDMLRLSEIVIAWTRARFKCWGWGESKIREIGTRSTQRIDRHASHRIPVARSSGEARRSATQCGSPMRWRASWSRAFVFRLWNSTRQLCPLPKRSQAACSSM